MRKIFNLPNTLTLLRIFLIPVIVAILLIKFENKDLWAFLVFAVASLTDFLDGFLARKFRKVTVVGELLDPVADKMLTSAIFISLVGIHPELAWMVVIIIGREFAVSGLRMIALSRGITIPASPAGKLKTVASIIAIAILILQEKLIFIFGEFTPFIGEISLWLVIILGVISGIRYFKDFWSDFEMEPIKDGK